MRKQIAKTHYQKTPLWMYLLLPLTWCYELGVWLRLSAYKHGLLKTVSVSVPVISVGNLTTGGTGKTPVVIALAEELMALDKKVVVLSRGYGASKPLDYGEPTSAANGDEAWLIKQTLPDAIVIVGKNRSENARRAIEDHQPDVILLDDGYQHIKLARDVNLLLIDGYQMVGNGCLLPVGPMREPLTEIKRADALWVTKTRRTKNFNQVSEWRTRFAKSPDVPVTSVQFDITGFRSVADGLLKPAELMKEKNILVFSGIAKPTIFHQDLENTGALIAGHLTFPDHHNYTQKDVHKILNGWDGKMPIVTTEKDRMKIEALAPEHMRDSMYTLVVRPIITAEALPAALKELLSLDLSHVKG